MLLWATMSCQLWFYDYDYGQTSDRVPRQGMSLFSIRFAIYVNDVEKYYVNKSENSGVTIEYHNGEIVTLIKDR